MHIIVPRTTDTKRPQANDDGVDHCVVCCDNDLSCCGLDVSRLPWSSDDAEQMCLVCDDLIDQPFCPKCGYLWPSLQQEQGR